MDATNHILVVDDHADIRDLLSQFLNNHGARVTTACGGDEMKKIINANRVDLIVLDIMMPGDDGLTLCQYVRATTQIPVILLTAVAEETDRIIGLEMGADDYLTKPFSPRELLARIKAVLRRTQSLPPQKQQKSIRQFVFDRWTLGNLRISPLRLWLSGRLEIKAAITDILVVCRKSLTRRSGHPEIPEGRAIEHTGLICRFLRCRSPCTDFRGRNSPFAQHIGV